MEKLINKFLKLTDHAEKISKYFSFFSDWLSLTNRLATKHFKGDAKTSEKLAEVLENVPNVQPVETKAPNGEQFTEPE